MPPVEIAGQQFERLTALHRDEHKRGTYWICRCVCGAIKSFRSRSLMRGLIVSCGCKKRDSLLRHGGSGTDTHTSWQSMLSRCRKKTPNYYMERGITVCQRWLKFENFLADMGERPEGMTLDRINNDGNYEPGNCRWATRSEQARNTRKSIHITYRGKTQPLVDWAKELRMSYDLLFFRLRIKWETPEFAFSRPSKKSHKQNLGQRRG